MTYGRDVVGIPTLFIGRVGSTSTTFSRLTLTINQQVSYTIRVCFTRLSTFIFAWFESIWVPEKQAKLFSNSILLKNLTIKFLILTPRYETVEQVNGIQFSNGFHQKCSWFGTQLLIWFLITSLWEKKLLVPKLTLKGYKLYSTSIKSNQLRSGWKTIYFL